MSEQKQPNILLITTDQQRWDTIHAAGNNHIFTPHLNWLCDTGVRFSNAYTECPVCMPARATIMTGLPAYRHGTVANDCSEPIRGRETLPSILTSAGYETRGQGKMHFEPMRKKFGFETVELSRDYYRFMHRHFGERVGARHGQGQNELEPVPGSTDENHTLTRWVINRSIDFLETRDPERPFFLWSSISKPHPPLDPSPNFWDIYRDASVPEPVYGDWSREFENIPPGFAEPSSMLGNAQRFDDGQLRRIRRAYYACITEIDSNLGILFSALREFGLLRDTLILFTSDHGEMLGDHHLGAKGVFFEGSAHVPLLIRPPGEWDENPLRGTVCSGLAGLQDILPTCLGASGLAGRRPPDACGIDLLEMASGRASRDALNGQCSSFYSRIEDGWKYLYSAAGDASLLFHLAEDPMETRDLSRSEPARLREMRSALLDELTQAGAPGIQDGDFCPLPASSPDSIRRWRSWPGFHLNTAETDLLH